MRPPNPILGVHVSPGAVAWARVLREEGGGYRVVTHGVEPAPEDPAEAVAHGARIIARRPFRECGSFLTFPDASGSLGPARLPAEEQDLAGDDLHRELHEHTPFEPEAAALRARLLGVEGRRRTFLVAALPAAQERRFRDAALAQDDGFTGLGYSGAALARGARALGISAPGVFVVEVLPRVTLVYATDDPAVRRYVISSGWADLAASAARTLGRSADEVRRCLDGPADATVDAALKAAAEDLAEDVKGVATYHRAQRYAPKDPPADLPAADFVAAGPSAGWTPLRRALAAHLSSGFAAATPQFEPEVRITWDDVPGGDPAPFAGAVGAALEAFQPPESRICLVAPPTAVPDESASAGRWVLIATAAGLIVALAVAGTWFTRPTAPRSGDPPRPPTSATPTSSTPTSATPTSATPTSATPTSATVEPHAGPAPESGQDESGREQPPDVAERADLVLTIGASSATTVELAWPVGPPRFLRRREPGAPDWKTVRTVGPEAGRESDEPVGGPGAYAWRLEPADGEPGSVAGAAVSAVLAPVTQCDLVDVAGDGRTTFRLTRTWRGRVYACDVTVAPGDAVAGRANTSSDDAAATTLVLDTTRTLARASIRNALEPVTTLLPAFLPDGRTVRAPDGSAPRTARAVPRPVRVLEAVLASPSGGPPVEVSRKMTDG